MTITPEKLAKLRELAQAATPGPWFVQEVPGSYSHVAHHVVVDGETLTGEPDTEEDTAFIAAADPKTVLALVEEVERLRRSDSELRAVMISVDKWFAEDDPVLAENPATRAAKMRADAVRIDGELWDKIDRINLLQARVAELEKNQ